MSSSYTRLRPFTKPKRREEWFALNEFPNRTVPQHYLSSTAIVHEAETASPYAALSPRIISALSLPSPFFDVLWPVIFEVADHKLQDVLHSTSSYFMNMWLGSDARRKSNLAREEYALATSASFKTGSEYPKELSLSPTLAQPATLWYSWSAEMVNFGSLHKFAKFCDLASRNGLIGTAHAHTNSGKNSSDSATEIVRIPLHQLFDGSFIFISSARDITVYLRHDPGNTQDSYTGDSGYVGDIACTGERTVVLKLEEWFIENIFECREMFRGWRRVVDKGVPF